MFPPLLRLFVLPSPCQEKNSRKLLGSVAMDGRSEASPRVKDPRTIARKYQLELCKKAVEENIIVYLGTGCGKTHIAVLLMYELGHLIRKPSKNICVFLAPTIPLVRQQAVVIENSTDFKVQCYYGGHRHLKDHDQWNKEIDQCEVLVMTPQILLHNLRHCFIKMDAIALLIFDECHHAQAKKRHPYAQIMKEFYKTDAIKSPRIFGMTASPIIGKGGSSQLNYTKCINSLETLLDAKVCSVDDTLELQKVVSSPNIKVCFYDTADHSASSLIGTSRKKLEEIKLQCISMIREKVHDLNNLQKSIKGLSRLHDNLVFCLENIGFCGARQAARVFLAADGIDAMESEIDNNNSDKCLSDQYLSKAISVLSGDLLYDDTKGRSVTLETLEEPFFSKKLLVLIEILSCNRLQENMKCIIFVKRIMVARSLAYILGNIKSLHYWKCEFLVGCHSGLKSMSRKKMNSIVEKFSSGEVNLLVATNVAEEGLDIQTCCLVVRFDLPETVASFIQSRGRARMITSEYVFLVERGNQREQKLLDDFMSGEDIMNKEISCRTSSETFDYLEEAMYKVSSTGASISTGCSVSLLHRYCAKLPCDIYFIPSPKFFYIDDINGTICRIILPPNAPIRQVESLPYPSKDEAKRNACLQACKELHERGALTDYLLPGLDDGKKNGSTMHHSKCDSTEDDNLREELHEMLVPAALKISWNNLDNDVNLFFYYIRFVPIPEDRQYQMFGLFVKAPLPKEAEALEVDLHLAHGRIVKTGFEPLGTLTFNKEETKLAENFQEMFLKVILDRSDLSSEFVPLGKYDASQHSSSIFYLLLPVKQQRYGENLTVDWTTIRRCLSSPVFGPITNLCEKDPHPMNDTLELLNGPINKCDVLNSLVFTPHNNLFFFVDGILHETNASSQYRGTRAMSYAEYYQNRFGIELLHLEQPFLKAKQLFSLRNLLHNRLQESTEAREMVEHFVELPAELCLLKIVGFSKDIGSSLSLLPSLMHRLENLLVAIELKEVLLASFPEASEVRANCILEALTTEKCLERLSLERFEVLGDAFLKYVVGRHSFVSYEGLDEGQLTRKRSSIVNNSNLYDLAIRKNLQVYIRDEWFDPAQFFALGRPCTVVCNVETESTIHQRGNNTTTYGAEAMNVKCTKSHHWLHKKTIADVVEALIGAFLVESGFKAAIAFLRWIGIQVDFEVSDVYRACELSKSNMSLIDGTNVAELEQLLCRTFRYKGLLMQALVHPSYNKHSGGCYQKLEFLGDAVLEYLITSYLYSAYPDLKPGQITDLRSITVNNNSFAHVAVWRSLHKYLIKDSNSLTEAVNKFETFIRLPESERDLLEEPACPKVLGDIIESCVGAVLLDTGFNLKLVWRLMITLLKPVLSFSSLQLNPVRELRELCQCYDFELGLPDPTKIKEGYFVKVEVDAKGNPLSCTATNKNSKAARRMAAQEALSKLKALGYKHKRKSLEEIVRSTRKKNAELIGFNEEPIVIENADSISLGKLQIQELEETPPMFDLPEARESPSSSINKFSIPSNAEGRPKAANSEAHRNKDQHEPVIVLHDWTDGATENQREINGALGRKMAKSWLFEICAANYWSPPSFECCKDEGPSHLRMFTYKVTVEVEGITPIRLECFGEAKPQKRAAEDHAAEGALWCLMQLGYVNKP
ncbi:endoribonuclease Dicer homolog 4 isoform X2 [Elaeis guineensis]|uniref:Endoribonuclease Dicer homolog 4 isoform X2 n=1 Tax=Elaeis guineensis var. tenera TaxID=51953 RepID=A0A6I9RUS0_ELAGV|nr:endoribonuclease Dicer homolog 4 isoform X2 [Elaeis guineensis]